jgi:hypothetical protein
VSDASTPPRSVVVLGAFVGSRVGSEEWRPYGNWEPGEVAADLAVPSVELWLAPDPDVKAWLAAVDAGEAIDLVVGGAEGDPDDSVVMTFESPEHGALELVVPAALVDTVARAALFTGDPLVITATTAPGPLEVRWWARAPHHEPDFVYVADPQSVRRAVLWRPGRSPEDPR